MLQARSISLPLSHPPKRDRLTSRFDPDVKLLGKELCPIAVSAAITSTQSFAEASK